LDELLLLLSQQMLSLVVGVLLPQVFNPLCLLDFIVSEFLPIIHCFFDSLVDSHQLLVVLHFLKFRRWLDFDCLDGLVQLGVELLHLVLMLNLQIFDLDYGFVLKLLEFMLPIAVELLELFVADVDVLLELVLLDVGPEFVLVLIEVFLKEADFAHEVLVQLILLHRAQFVRQDVHLLLDKAEDQDLLVLVEGAVAALVENLQELLRRGNPQQVEDNLLAVFKDQLQVGFVD
jgi:hypothetical protein